MRVLLLAVSARSISEHGCGKSGKGVYLAPWSIRFKCLGPRRPKFLADAQREAEALDADARELERLAALAEKYGYSSVEKQQSNGVVPNPFQTPFPFQTDTPAFDAKTPAYRAAISVAENAIKAAGQPLELSVIFDACVDQHVPLAGKRPQSTLSAYLSHGASKYIP